MNRPRGLRRRVSETRSQLCQSQQDTVQQTETGATGPARPTTTPPQSHAPHEHASHADSLFHSHTHQHNELLRKGFLTNPAVRITWIGLVVNVLMVAAKGVGGVHFHSQALVADAIHSVSDTVADFLTLATVNFVSKEGLFSKFPLGYGKIESVGTFLVSTVLLAAGLSVGWSSLLQILEMLLPTTIYEYLLVFQVHSHLHFGTSHDHNNTVSNERHLSDINAAWLALALIGVKELLYHKTMAVAKKTHSSVLAANAWHHRVDSLTAGVAAVSVTLGVLLGISWLDAVGGLLVSTVIVNVGLGTLFQACYELVDRGADPASEQYQQVKLVVEEAVATVAESVSTSGGLGDMNLQMVEFSLLPAGARSNVIIKMAADGSPSLAAVCAMEEELIDRIKLNDKSVGKVFIDYRVDNGEETQAEKR